MFIRDQESTVGMFPVPGCDLYVCIVRVPGALPWLVGTCAWRAEELDDGPRVHFPTAEGAIRYADSRIERLALDAHSS